MERTNTYSEKAQHCREAAKQTISLDLKICFLEVARTWEMLAEYNAFRSGIFIASASRSDGVQSRVADGSK